MVTPPGAPPPGAAPRGARRPAGRGLPLRLLGALALGVSGAVHLRIALDRPPLLADGGVTLSGLFLGQAVTAGLACLAVLLSGRRWAWLAFGAVALASLAALVASVLVRVPAVGPFPALYEPVWYPDKVVSAVSAGVAVLLAAVALVRVRTGRGVSRR